MLQLLYPQERTPVPTAKAPRASLNIPEKGDISVTCQDLNPGMSILNTSLQPIHYTDYGSSSLCKFSPSSYCFNLFTNTLSSAPRSQIHLKVLPLLKKTKVHVDLKHFVE